MTSTRKANLRHSLLLMALLAAAAGLVQSRTSFSRHEIVSRAPAASRVAPSPRVLDDMVIPKDQGWTDEDQEEEQPETPQREPLEPLIDA